MTAAPLVLYDGRCALCDRWIRFLARADRRGTLRFAPLGGETAAAIVARRPDLAAIDSLVFVARGPGGEERVAVRSAAVVGALRAAGGAWRFVAALVALAPRPLRDRVYDAVATRRRRWFGELAECPLPPAARRDRFLP